MTSSVRYVLVVAAALALGACRQADGQMPTPSADTQAELGDIVRDLQNIATSSDPQAPQDLVDDLKKYADRVEAEPAVEALSRSTASAVSGLELPEQSAERLAHSLWTSIAAQELSERQIESLQTDMRLLLVSVGVTEASAEQVASQVGEVQQAVSARPRRWYEVF
jgi:hypothetical protein